jgi:hypothetical protein
MVRFAGSGSLYVACAPSAGNGQILILCLFGGGVSGRPPLTIPPWNWSTEAIGLTKAGFSHRKPRCILKLSVWRDDKASLAVAC